MYQKTRRKVNLLELLMKLCIFMPVYLFLLVNNVFKLNPILILATLLLIIIAQHTYFTFKNFHKNEHIGMDSISRKDNMNIDSTILIMVLFFVMSIYFNKLDYTLFFRMTCYNAILYLLLYVSREFICNFSNFVRVSHGMYYSYIAKMMLRNLGYIWILFGSIGLLAFVINSILGSVEKPESSLIRKLLLHLEFNNKQGVITPSDEIVKQYDDEFAKNSTHNLILQYLIMFAILCFLIFVFYHLIRYLYEKKIVIRENSQILIDETEIKLERMKRKTKAVYIVKNNNDKVRKVFYKMVSFYRKRDLSITAADTPVQIQGKVEYRSGINMRELTTLYEQARYGNRQMTTEEVVRAKKEYKK